MLIVAIALFEILGAISRQVHARVVGADQLLLIQEPNRELQVLPRASDHSLELTQIDTWVVRLTARDQKRTKTYHALEDLNLDYDAAKEKAEAWIEQTTHTAVRKVKRGTVRAALEAYLADLIKHNRAGRLDRTINRQVRSVVAALNRALELGHVGNPLAWKLKKLSDDTEDTNETAVLGPDGVKKDD